jgi:hypothetical protein
MAYAPLSVFQNLNMFLREEAIPQYSDESILKANLIHIPENGLNFTILTIMETPSYRDTVPDSLVPLLTRLYTQINELLTVDIHQLKDFIQPRLGHDEEIVFDIEAMVKSIGSSLYLWIEQAYVNVYDYIQRQGSTNITDNLLNIQLVERTINDEQEIPLFQIKEHSLTGQPVREQIGVQKVRTFPKPFVPLMSDFDTKHENPDPTQMQIFSLLKLIWAVESINKIKTSLFSGKKTYIFLDNRDFQVRMLMNPIYATRLNLDQLALYERSPLYSERLKEIPLTVERSYKISRRKDYSSKYLLDSDVLPNSWSRISNYMFYEENQLVELFYLPKQNAMRQ